jgi:hypothetical protein
VRSPARSLVSLARSYARSLVAGLLVRSLDVAGIARWCQSLAGMVRWSGFVAFVRRSLRSQCAKGRILRARAVPRLLRSLLLCSCLPWPPRVRFIIDSAVLSHPISWLGASVVRHVDELTSRREGAADGRALWVCFPTPCWVGGRFARPW